MLPSTILAAQALMTFASAIAVPSPAALEASGAKIDAPTHLGVYICSEPNWKGTCEHIFMNPGICFDVDANIADTISCIGPDKPASGCYAYTMMGCQGDKSAQLTYPGISTLQYAPGFDNKVKSFICY